MYCTLPCSRLSNSTWLVFCALFLACFNTQSSPLLTALPWLKCNGTQGNAVPPPPILHFNHCGRVCVYATVERRASVEVHAGHDVSVSWSSNGSRPRRHQGIYRRPLHAPVCPCLCVVCGGDCFQTERYAWNVISPASDFWAPRCVVANGVI